MKGNVRIASPVLIYTAYASPLTVETVDDDISEIDTRYASSPIEIVLWEHQADFIVKKMGNSFVEQAAADTDGSRLKYLFGIPVRYAK